MATPKQTTPVVVNLSLSMKAKTANKNMAANQPIQQPTPSKPGL